MVINVTLSVLVQAKNYFSAQQEGKTQTRRRCGNTQIKIECLMYDHPVFVSCSMQYSIFTAKSQHRGQWQGQGTKPNVCSCRSSERTGACWWIYDYPMFLSTWRLIFILCFNRHKTLKGSVLSNFPGEPQAAFLYSLLILPIFCHVTEQMKMIRLSDVDCCLATNLILDF